VSGFGAQDIIDLPGIVFDAQTTFDYLPNSKQMGSTLSNADAPITSTSRFSAITWHSYVMTSDSHGCTMVMADAMQFGSQSLLANLQHA
jgi:hypothetical protein